MFITFMDAPKLRRLVMYQLHPILQELGLGRKEQYHWLVRKELFRLLVEF